MSGYLMRLSSIIGLVFSVLIGLAVGVGYLLPESLQFVYTEPTAKHNRLIFWQDFNRGLGKLLSNPLMFGAFAIWSPDGKRMAYTLAKDSETFYVYILDQFGHKQQVFSLSFGSQHYKPIWSPDGRYIMVSTGSSERELQTILLNLNTGDFDFLQQYIGTGIWSPDSQKIRFYEEGEFGLLHLYEINSTCTLDTALCEPKELDLSQFGQLFTVLKWSPDEQKIAFTQAGEQNAKIMIAHLKCTELVAACISDIDNLTDTPVYDNQPAWSPDSTQIAFVSGRSNLNIVTIATGEIQTFNTPGISPYLKDWSPDGRFIAYPSDYTGIANTYLLDVITGESRPVFANKLTGVYPEWRPMQP